MTSYQESPLSGANNRSPVARVGDARPGPHVRGDAVLRRLERFFLRLDRLVERALPPALNPFAHTGAVCTAAGFVAIVSGVLLLFWYTPSLQSAWSSVEAMGRSPWSAGLLRSLHRYSSDVAVLFALLHGLRLFFERRLAGPRWLAWTTGVLLAGSLWLIGWIGYWLVWDEAASRVAVVTAKLVDLLPILSEPLSRSFLTDDSLNPLLFFIVFFAHILVPLLLAGLLWLHLARVARPKLIGARPLLIWVGVVLLAVSVLWPATSSQQARMTALPGRFLVDAWYLLPLWPGEVLGGGALWGLVLVAGVVLLGMPWWMARGRVPVANVDLTRCNGCSLCAEDCPYEAITLEPRSDGRAAPVEARVDAAACVGCGICAGACASVAFDFRRPEIDGARRWLSTLLREARGSSKPPLVVFACASSAAAELKVDPATGACSELPGCIVMPVPCAGWIQAGLLERAVRHGAAGAVVVSCGGACQFREGTTWLEERIGGTRKPAFRPDKVDGGRVRLLRLDRTQRDALRVLAGGNLPPPEPGPEEGRAGRGVRRAVAWLVLAGVIGGLTVAGTLVPYTPPHHGGPELVVSFRHPGRPAEGCRAPTPEEIADLPPHMRPAQICKRGRLPVRLRVRVDGAVVAERAYAPSGIFSDGNSLAVEYLPVAPGSHNVEVEIGDTAGPDEWAFRDARSLDFPADMRRVVLFDRVHGFSWH